MTTDTTFHVGTTWQTAGPFATRTLWFVPRIGETIEFADDPDIPLCKVIDVKHMIIDDVQCVEVLICRTDPGAATLHLDYPG